MIFYFLYLFLIIFLCGRYRLSTGIKSVNKNLKFDITIFFIIAISSLRFNIGFDWSQYLSFVYPKCDFKYLKRVEPLSSLYMYIAAVMNSPIIMFSLFAITNYGIIGNIIKKESVSKYESLIIYFSLFYLESLSILRQATALAIVLYGYKFIKEKKLLKYFLCCFVAFLYHRTAIISVVFYFLYYSKSIFIIFALTIFSVTIKIILPKLLGNFFPYFLIYLEKNGIANQSGNFIKLVYLALFFYCLFLKSKKDIESSRMLNICSFGVLLPFILGGHTGSRIAMYFLIYYVFLIPRINKKFPIQYKVLFLIPFYAYFFIYLLVTVISNHTDEYVPFRWYFLEDLNQKLR